MRYDDEILVIRGQLDHSGRFTPMRCRSTKTVHQWPEVDHSEYKIELLDADDSVLHRELALVTPEIGCEPGAPRAFRLLGYIGLHPSATAVRVRWAEIVLWRVEIPAAPELRVQVQGEPHRDEPLEVRLRYTEPGDDAHVTVVYQWGDRRFRPLYIGAPSETIAIDLGDMPGGDKCRFVVDYSNGLRSAGDATETFKLPVLGPLVTIEQPGRGAIAIAGTPVQLEGHVSDPERPGGAKPDEHLAWYIDGEQVGRGPISSVDALAPGRREVALVYDGEPGARISTELIVQESQIPTANEWPDWDPTDDDTTIATDGKGP